MKPYPVLLISVAAVFALGVGPAHSQVAVEPRSPAPEESDTAEKPAKAEKSANPDQPSEQSVEPAPATEPEQSAKPSRSRRPEKPVSALQDSMTAAEFKASGLNKLSSEELENLNRWLQGYRRTAETKATEKATVEATKKANERSKTRLDVLNSHVAGTFAGVTGRSIITLEDGSKWKQSDPKDRFKAQNTDNPPCVVIHTVFGYKMRILGTPEFYVDPVRK